MSLLVFLSVSFIILFAAYVIFGRYLTQLFHLSREQSTPAHLRRDGLDYEPARASYLLPQHFSAIAAAGPIVGPILAAMYFGWVPAWLWIIFGSILIGGIHDFTALVASVRHQGRSVAEIVRAYMNPRAHVLFLIFIWCALVYVIVAFTDVTAGTFVQAGNAKSAEAPGPAVATSSTLYLLLAFAMGLALRFTGLGPVQAKMIFLPLVAVAIVAGPWLPMDLGRLMPGADTQQVQQVWGYILLGYCFVAAMVPVWLLLQPRGELGGYFLYIVMGVGVLGLTVGALNGSFTIQAPAFKGWNAQDAFGSAMPLLPILFITVACGACSGFHSIVASGTTSKQLDRETDARPVAYGGMLLEGFFACLSLATLMILAPSQQKGGADAIYANGIANFAAQLLAPLLPANVNPFAMLYQFALLCFATFVFDTLDACTRLARYVLMELFGWTSRRQAVTATILSLIVPAIAIALPRVNIDGKALPLWKVFWNIFGSSNQLLAALTLLGVTVWLARKRMAYWLTLWPAVFMMVVTLWSLVLMLPPYFAKWKSGQSIEAIHHFQFLIIVSLIGLALWLVVEAFITWRSLKQPPATDRSEIPAGEALPSA
jgi:carbon starvation protein